MKIFQSEQMIMFWIMLTVLMLSFSSAAAKKLLKASVQYGYLSSTSVQTDKVSDKLVNTVELKSPVLCSGVSGDDQQF